MKIVNEESIQKHSKILVGEKSRFALIYGQLNFFLGLACAIAVTRVPSKYWISLFSHMQSFAL
jgi:hypothetical protein